MKQKSPFYFDLFDVMNDRASTNPIAISYYLDTSSGDTDTAEEGDGDFWMEFNGTNSSQHQCDSYSC